MFEFVIGSMLAQRAVRSLASSALPNAQVVPAPHLRLRKAKVRRSVAAAMHHAADRLTPAVCAGS